MLLTPFRSFCARCHKHHNVTAVTLSGAIKKATIECNGIIQTAQGPKLTRCAPGMSGIGGE